MSTAENSPTRYLWLIPVLTIFSIYTVHIWNLASKNDVLCGKDYFLHSTLMIKYAQLKLHWPDIIDLYGSLEKKAYALQLHYPPLSYLSSIFVYKLSMAPSRAAVTTNTLWMLAAVLAIFLLIVRYTKSGFWGSVGATTLLSAYWVKCTVFDVGCRIPALAVAIVGLMLFAYIAEDKKGWWRWAIIGLVLGISGLVHVLAFIAIFAMIFADNFYRFLSDEGTIWKRGAFAIFRLSGVLVLAGFVMAIFYMPAALAAPSHFMRELRTEGVIDWARVKLTFCMLPRDFLELFSDNWHLAALVIAGAVAALFLGGQPTKMLLAILVLLASLLFGSTYSGRFYLIPYLAVIIPASLIGIAGASKKLGKLLSVLLSILIILLLAKSVMFNLNFDECIVKDKNFCADYPEIEGLSAALQNYNHIPQNRIGFVDCRGGEWANPGDIALVAMALARKDSAKNFWPYVHLIYNYPLARAQLDLLQKAEVVCVISDELGPDGEPICDSAVLSGWQRDVGVFSIAESFRIGKKWAVFYKRLDTLE